MLLGRERRLSAPQREGARRPAGRVPGEVVSFWFDGWMSAETSVVPAGIDPTDFMGITTRLSGGAMKERRPMNSENLEPPPTRRPLEPLVGHASSVFVLRSCSSFGEKHDHRCH